MTGKTVEAATNSVKSGCNATRRDMFRLMLQVTFKESVPRQGQT